MHLSLTRTAVITHTIFVTIGDCEKNCKMSLSFSVYFPLCVCVSKDILSAGQCPQYCEISDGMLSVTLLWLP